MLIQVRWKDVLGLIYNFLGMYSEMFQIYPLTAIHLLQGIVMVAKGLFLRGIPNLLCKFIILVTDILHIKPAVKCFFLW